MFCHWNAPSPLPTCGMQHTVVPRYRMNKARSRRESISTSELSLCGTCIVTNKTSVHEYRKWDGFAWEKGTSLQIMCLQRIIFYTVPAVCEVCLIYLTHLRLYVVMNSSSKYKDTWSCFTEPHNTNSSCTLQNTLLDRQNESHGQSQRAEVNKKLLCDQVKQMSITDFYRNFAVSAIASLGY